MAFSNSAWTYMPLTFTGTTATTTVPTYLTYGGSLVGAAVPPMPDPSPLEWLDRAIEETCALARRMN